MSENAKQRKPKDIFKEGAISPDFIAESIRKHSTKHSIGAHEIFLGQVRADCVVVNNKEQKVTSIEYTTYREMALETMHEIRERAFEQFDITCMHVYHSIGTVGVGEICFFVFASSAHRKDARAAVAFLVDSIKDKLPIFGQERLANEGHQWKVNK